MRRCGELTVVDGDGCGRNLVLMVVDDDGCGLWW